ncbi:hypothetical protein BAUCODRAFT_67414 [Baudoinia panamericana UAMH 10762]|uniref:JmjC domain-containing protein n=1 Tax=Baudoinia panamericana (strain UAMH 10762) TaxID=717646 RepID=M2MMM2_BAUPA|nr:uncharacterized protein BAUCODRAFT_67414 [Baudoinia panamericana UAMH 10762]EMC97941.1 hypothetical protein BAUCODRAFT_67414 [Baudoinia panamericana UAMH 10762]
MTTTITSFLEGYHELNAAVIDELSEQPSPLEFMRYVARNRPFVVRRVATDWQAYRRWDAAYLRQMMADEQVKVAVTPLGNADAVVEQSDGHLLFVEPYETYHLFNNFLNEIQRPIASREPLPVKYAQTQNDNLREEYARLLPDVPSDIPFARIALDQSADAVNLWLGDNRSVTSLHKDNYENIYVQIRGQKHFVLLAPADMPCVNEQMLRQGRYVPATSANGLEDVTNAFAIEISDSDERIPVATWDPDLPDERTTAYTHLAKPLRVTLNEGDMLYLPAMWYHKVSQTVGAEGFACAVNYWYDMDFSGYFWSSNALVRDMVEAERLTPKYPKLEMQIEQ